MFDTREAIEEITTESIQADNVNKSVTVLNEEKLDNKYQTV